MKRAVMVVTLVTLAALGAVTLAQAASGPKPGWEAVVGHSYKTKTDAEMKIARLTTKDFMGYGTETEKANKATRYEVEKEFSTQKLAQAEVLKLHKAGFRAAALESSSGTR